MEPTFKIDERRVVAALQKVPAELQRNLEPAIRRWADRALGIAQSAEPSRTGKLRAETRAFVDRGDNFIRGRVRVLNEDGRHNVRAAALEYGAHRPAKVGAHTMNLGHFWDHPASDLVSVGPYQRRTNIAARRFLRSAIAATHAQAKAEIEAAVNLTARTGLDAA